MWLVAILFAVLLSGLGSWAVYQSLRLRVPAAPGTAPVIDKIRAASVPLAVDFDQVAAANARLTGRLWRLAFAAHGECELRPADTAIRERVAAVLGADRLDAKFFPRRPTLMPQLLRAVEQPRAAIERWSRIVAHDPVLAADVLRLANSSRFRNSARPIETIQRAIVVMGVDALRGLLAAAMLQPVFRASRSNFPRFPRMLWERTERATRAAEAYAIQHCPGDRFEAQLAILLSALGPLAVYGATLDVYAQDADSAPNPELCVELICVLSRKTALRIAQDWETSPRLAAALEQISGEPLAHALGIGEMLGTLSLLQSQHVIEGEEVRQILDSVNLNSELLESAGPRAV